MPARSECLQRLLDLTFEANQSDDEGAARCLFEGVQEMLDFSDVWQVVRGRERVSWVWREDSTEFLLDTRELTRLGEKISGRIHIRPSEKWASPGTYLRLELRRMVKDESKSVGADFFTYYVDFDKEGKVQALGVDWDYLDHMGKRNERMKWTDFDDRKEAFVTFLGTLAVLGDLHDGFSSVEILEPLDGGPPFGDE